MNKGAVSEIITSQTGMTVEENNVNELAEAIAKILKDRISARRKGEEARKRVLGHFTELKRAEDTMQAYRIAWQKKHSP